MKVTTHPSCVRGEPFGSAQDRLVEPCTAPFGKLTAGFDRLRANGAV